MEIAGIPLTWEEIEEYGLEEASPDYEPSEDEKDMQHQTDGRENAESTDQKPS